ncbi:MAG: hypothetical protein GY906_22515 [bacterium]|nr:hypothetical protein [bacterium]
MKFGHELSDANIGWEIYQDFREALPTNQTQYRSWLHKASKKWKRKVTEIEVIVADHEFEQVRQIQNTVATEAEAVATALGLSLQHVLTVLGKQLEATKKRPLTDHQGRIRRDCDKCNGTGRRKLQKTGKEDRKTRPCAACKGTGGDIIWLETPDNAAINAAVAMFLKVWGATKPDKLEIDGQLLITQAPVEELFERYTKLQRTAGKYIRAQSSRPGNGADRAGVGSPALLEGQVLLDGAGDQDAGRAGSNEPVQAVPSEDIPADDSELS